MGTTPSRHLQEFLERQAAAVEVDELWDLVIGYFDKMGIPLVSYHHYAPPGSPHEATRIRSEGFPADWVCHYIDQKLLLVDPIPDFALRTTRPFFWSEVGLLGGLIAEQLAYLDELDATGIGDGLAVQAFGPGMRNGYFGLGFGGKKRLLIPEETGEFQMICQVAHLRYCDLVPVRPIADPVLSQREREVLEWIARGKSNSVIGEILNLSTHTVDAYLRRIYSKLGVSDRTTAAIRGVGSGLIRGEV